MKTLLALILSSVLFNAAPDLSKLRIAYPKANSNEVIANNLFEELTFVTKEDDKTLVAYKGAISTLKAKFAKNFRNKKMYFKDGAMLIEYVLELEPNNIEVRCLRLSVQENAPKIVGYNKNIAEDKQYILDHYSEISDTEIKNFIKGYILLSNAFSESEKQLF